MIFRESWMSKEDFLFRIYNKGATDLRICYNYFKDGEMMFSKWVRYDHLMELGPDDWVEGTIDKRNEFIKKSSHRTMHPLELVYDIDECVIDYKNHIKRPRKDFLVHEYKTYPDIKSLSQKLYERLKREYSLKVYFTGNKSYHIHTINPWLARMSRYEREKEKEKLLMKAGADTQKKSENTPIAIELEPHYRSGKPKEELLW